MLRIGEGLELPDTVAQEVTLILGTRGQGKSYTAGVVLEELNKNNIQFVCLDTLGAHRRISLPNVEVLNIRDGQTLNINKLVNRLMTSNKSVIINMMDMNDTKRQQNLVGDYCTAMLSANPASHGKVITTVIEEAEEFAPQGNAKHIMESIVPLNRITKLGRARGCGMIFVTQRPQDMSAKLRSQASNFIVHRLTNYTELDVMKKQLVAASRGETKPIIQKIFGFERGEAMFLSPSVPDGLAFAKVRPRDTEHAGSNVLGDGNTSPTWTTGPPEPPLAYGSTDDLNELLVPIEPEKKKDQFFDIATKVIIAAVIGVSGYIVYDQYRKGQERVFEANEIEYGEAKAAIFKGTEEEAKRAEEEKRPKFEDPENMHQKEAETPSFDGGFDPPFPGRPHDPEVYDPFAP